MPYRNMDPIHIIALKSIIRLKSGNDILNNRFSGMGIRLEPWPPSSPTGRFGTASPSLNLSFPWRRSL